METVTEQMLLHVRGFLYAYASVMTFLSSLPIAPHANGRMKRANKRQKRILALYFFALSIGGISSFLSVPEIGHFVITYAATALILLYCFYISFFVIFRQ